MCRFSIGFAYSPFCVASMDSCFIVRTFSSCSVCRRLTLDSPEPKVSHPQVPLEDGLSQNSAQSAYDEYGHKEAPMECDPARHQQEPAHQPAITRPNHRDDCAGESTARPIKVANVTSPSPSRSCGYTTAARPYATAKTPTPLPRPTARLSTSSRLQ